MQTVEQGLGRAAADGIISAEQAERLLTYLAAPEDGGKAAALVDDAMPTDTETPRFIRGFHDVLITVGILILFAGLAGLGSVLVLPPIILVLTEILVRRQRLALPAVVLTAAFAFSILSISITYLANDIADTFYGPLYKTIMVIGPLVAALVLYAWRYRVPVAVAALLVSATGFAVLLSLAFLAVLLGERLLLTSYPLLTAIILFAFALGLFALAMRYDLSDPKRVTRRSDIAFWVHLATAPALLSSGVNLLLPWNESRLTSIANAGFTNGPLQIAVVVTVMIMVGLIIDRRAFVTSGLLSLIVAFASLFNRGASSSFQSNDWALATLSVGLLVLILGIGWRPIRGFVIAALPVSWQNRLPPVK